MHEELYRMLNRQESKPVQQRQQTPHQAHQQQPVQQRFQPAQRPPYQQQQRQPQYSHSGQQQGYARQPPQQQQQHAAPVAGQQRYQQQRGNFPHQGSQGQQQRYPSRGQQWRPRPSQPPFNAEQQHGSREYRQPQSQENSQIGSAPRSGHNQNYSDFRHGPKFSRQPTPQQLMEIASTLLQQQQRRNSPDHYNRRNQNSERPPRQKSGGQMERRQGGRVGRGGRYHNQQQHRDDRQRSTSRDHRDKNYRKNVRPREHHVEQEEAQEEEEDEEEQQEEEHEEEEDEGSENEQEEEEQENEEENEEEDEAEEQEQEKSIPPPIRSRQELVSPSAFQRSEKKIDYKPVAPTKHHSVREEEESTGIEKCTKMCPDKEFQDRLKIFREINSPNQPLRLDSESWFGVFEVSRNTQQPDQRITLKRFKRAATGSGEEEQSTIVRTPAALRQTMEHILKYIVDADNVDPSHLPFIQPVDKAELTFDDIYKFLWNRMRAMIKEISQLTPAQQRLESIITVSEQIARFFILSINQMRMYPDYDDQLNQKNLEKILAQLLQAYRQSKQELKRLLVELKKQGRTTLSNDDILREMERRNIYVSPFEPEISGYAMVFSSKENIDQHLGNMTDDLKELSSNPILEARDMRRALEMLSTINDRNIAKYFRGMDSEDTGYLLACTMLFHVNSMRKEAVTRVMKSCRDDSEVLSLPLLDEWLNFQNSAECVTFLKHIGAKLTMDESGIVKETLAGEDGLHYATPYYQFPFEKLNREFLEVPKNPNKKLINAENISREDIIRGLSIPRSNYDRRLIDLCKYSIWQATSSEEESVIAPRNEPFIDLKRTERPSPPPQTSQQRANLLEKIKKNKHQKFLESLKGRLVDFFRAGFDRKKRQREKFNRMFHILSMNMDRQEELGFHRIRAVSEYRKLLQKNLHGLKKATQRSKAFSKELRLPNDYQLFGKRERHRHRSTEGITPVHLDPDEFEEKCAAEGFFGSLCELYLQLPASHFSEQEDFSLRIVMPVDAEYAHHHEPIKVLVTLVKYLTRLLGVEHFADFLTDDEKNEATFEECLSFTSNLQNGDKHTRIHLSIEYFKYRSESELIHRFDEELYGASLLLMPLVAESKATAEEFARAMGYVDEALWNVPVVIVRMCSQPDQQLDRDFVAPLVKTVTVVNQGIYSIGVDPIAKDAILDSLGVSISASRPFESVRRFSILRYLGEMQLNMKYLQPEIRHGQLRFYYYQEYLNACFRCLYESAADVFEQRHTLSNWPEEVRGLRKCCTPNDQTLGQNDTVRSATAKQQTFMDCLFNHLNMDLIDCQYYYRSNKLDYFLARLMTYLEPLIGGGRKRLRKEFQRFHHKTKEICFANREQLPDGDLQQLFGCIFDAIMEGLHLYAVDCDLLLPDNFIFQLSSEVLPTFMQAIQAEVQRKHGRILRQLTEREATTSAKEQMLQRLASRRDPPRQMVSADSFVYPHRALYEEYLQRVRHHKNEALDITSQPA